MAEMKNCTCGGKLAETQTERSGIILRKRKRNNNKNPALARKVKNDRFVVKSTDGSDVRFGWEVSALRKDYLQRTKFSETFGRNRLSPRFRKALLSENLEELRSSQMSSTGLRNGIMGKSKLFIFIRLI